MAVQLETVDGFDREQLYLPPEKRVIGIVERWEEFVSGRQPDFLAYFMLGEDGVKNEHDATRRLFLAHIRASAELPGDDLPLPVLSIGRATLLASVYVRDALNNPSDVAYTGVRIEPVQ